jgi:hypothetical protein
MYLKVCCYFTYQNHFSIFPSTTHFISISNLGPSPAFISIALILIRDPEFPLPYAHRILQPNFQNHQDHEQYRQHQYQNHLDPFQTLIKNLTFSLTQNPPSPYRSPATSARSNLPTTPTLPYLLSLLRCYSPNGMHWSKYALANPQKQYTRNLVYEVPGVFNLLMLVWTPGRKSPVHDHARSDCLMKVSSFSDILGSKPKDVELQPFVPVFIVDFLFCPIYAQHLNSTPPVTSYKVVR